MFRAGRQIRQRYLFEFQEWKAEAKRVADQLDAASRIQLTVLTENDLRGLKVAAKSPKS